MPCCRRIACCCNRYSPQQVQCSNLPVEVRVYSRRISAAIDESECIVSPTVIVSYLLYTALEIVKGSQVPILFFLIHGSVLAVL